MSETLQELARQVRHREHLWTMIKDLEKQHGDVRWKVRDLEELLRREQADVAELEKTSLKSVFYSLLGKKEERMEQERLEACAAKVKYDAAHRELAALEEELRRRNAELLALGDCQLRYAQALEAKLEAVRESEGPARTELVRLETEYSTLEERKKELQEAIWAGGAALKVAKQVKQSLDNADAYSTWDVMGGGLLADLAKHDELDNAQEQVEQLQAKLRKFRAELADVTIDTDIQVSIQGFDRFADFFFDNIFTDWSVRDRIRSSQESVNRTVWQIESTMEKLRGMMTQTDAEMARLKQRMDDVVIGAEV